MRRAWIVMFTVVCGLLGMMPASAQTAELRVDAGQMQGAISPFVYGVNYGPWSLASPDVLPLIAEAGVTHLRFPAGRWGDEYDLAEQQIDLFMLQARGWDADVSISARLEGGTPEQAAALVRYVNLEKGYAVRHWSIGNEPDLYREYTQERFNAEWRAMAEAMQAVDPDILLIGPEVSQFPPTVAGDPYTNVRREWLRGFLEANGDLVDIVSIHRYPFPVENNRVTTIDDLRRDAPQWDVLVDNLRMVIRETTGGDLPMALTEVNSHWNTVIDGEASPDSAYHAVWWADVLGGLIRQQVSIVNYFMLSSHGNLGAFGLVDRYEARPTYYVYQLYRQFGGELVASESSAADVSVTAALRTDGALTLMVVNRAPEAMSTALTLAGFVPTEAAQMMLLDAAHLAEATGMQAFGEVTMLELPAESVTLYVLPG